VHPLFPQEDPGSTDQFLNNPPACHFNPAKLSLTPDKVEAVEKIFSGPPGIFPGYRLGGDEASNSVNWPAWLTDSGNPADALQEFFGDNFFMFMVFPNSGWTPSTFSAAENAQQADARTGAILNSINPNLLPFKQHGGKLIQYVGWGDTAISPQNDINYHQAVTQEMGGDMKDFYRSWSPEWVTAVADPVQMRSVTGSTGRTPPTPRTT
jgi:feruloyl esterase